MKEKSIAQVLSRASSEALFVFPIALSVGVLSGFGMLSSVMTAVAAAVFGFEFKGRSMFPALVLFLTYLSISRSYGIFCAVLSLASASVILLILSRFKLSYFRSLLTDPVITGFSSGAAIMMIIMETTNYFDIGAVGSNAIKIITSYRYNGFLPNWNTVLYGTITLVLLITYPIKFKKFSKIVPASFWAIPVTAVLNIFLNPDVGQVVVPEIGKYSLFSTSIYTSAGFGRFSWGMIPAWVSSSLAIAIVLFVCEVNEKTTDKHELHAICAIEAICALGGAFPLARRNVSDLPPLPVRIAQAVISAALFGVLYPFVRRLPLSVPAVILIVMTFQSLDYGAVMATMKSGRYSISIFVGCTIVEILLGLPFTALYMALITCFVILIKEFRKGKIVNV